MNSRDFPARRWFAGLTVLVLAGSLAACTSDKADGDAAATPTRKVTPSPISLVRTLSVGSADHPEDPFVTRSGDTTVTSFDSVVRAFAPTGTAKWTFSLPKTAKSTYGVGTAVYGAVTILTWTDRDGDTVARAVDTATGRARWTYRTSEFIDPSPRTVFATACDDDDRLRCTLRALEPATGNVRWTRKVPGRPYPRTDSLEPPRATAVVVDVDYGPLGSDSLRTSYTESVDETTGRSRRFAVPPTASYVAGADHVAVFTTTDDRPKNGCTSQVIAADVRNGRRIWSRTLPVVDDDYCGDLDAIAPDADSVAVHPRGSMPIVLDIRSGRTIAAPGTGTGTVAARTKNITYVQKENSDSYGQTGDRTVTAVRDSGSAVWSLTQDGYSEDTLGVVGSLLLVGNDRVDRTSSVVRASTGALVQRVAGRISGYGDDWFATWDRKVVRIYDVRG